MNSKWCDYLKILIISICLLDVGGQASKMCTIEKIHFLRSFLGKEIFYGRNFGLKCNIKTSNFTLDFNTYNMTRKMIREYIKTNNDLFMVEFNWILKESSSFSLTRQFNLRNFIRLFTNFYFYALIMFRNLKRIELDLFDDQSLPDYSTHQIHMINSDMIFTIDGKPMKSCSDINLARNGSLKIITSLFQIPLAGSKSRFYLFGCRFPLTLCSGIFKNFKVREFLIFDLVDTFYKRNLMKFWSNETFPSLNSNITNLYLFHSENIALDTSFLNPLVFANLEHIQVNCMLNSIGVDLFASLKNLIDIKIETKKFRKLIHHNRNGIEWIKGINRHIHVNLSDLQDFLNNYEAHKRIILNTEKSFHIDPMYQVFPEEDFCIYKDFPFEQLVFTFQFCSACLYSQFEYVKQLNPMYTCTYLWINQYDYLLTYVLSSNSIQNLMILLDSDSYKNINKCDFKRRLALCNRSEYHLKDFWSTEDFYILNKKIQIGVKILTYLVSLLSIATNILVIRIIFAKHNKHVFKDFKHYTYLGLISVFNLFISVIEIVSWMSECFFPFEVFCLGVHKTIVAQLFKMVIKECLVTALRFLSNFCYIAFALCRISLIGQDHGKLVKFMSKVTILKCVLYSLVISLAFSWIKYFKYSINFEFGELNHPIWNERDFTTLDASLPSILDFYMIFNVISDLLNYFVFVAVCFLVDLSMLVKLRSTVSESINRVASMLMNEKQMEKKKSELEETMNKSIRMVIVNTSISLLFKLPLVFLPLMNTFANFFYKNINMRNSKPGFDRFYTNLFDTDFYLLIHESTDLLYLISISIQFFIYKKFDKKFQEGTFSPPSPKNSQN